MSHLLHRQSERIIESFFESLRAHISHDCLVVIEECIRNQSNMSFHGLIRERNSQSNDIAHHSHYVQLLNSINHLVVGHSFHLKVKFF